MPLRVHSTATDQLRACRCARRYLPVGREERARLFGAERVVKTQTRIANAAQRDGAVESTTTRKERFGAGVRQPDHRTCSAESSLRSENPVSSIARVTAQTD